MTHLLALVLFIQSTTPAYITRGDRVEQRYRAYREKLNSFFAALREELGHQTVDPASALAEAPPQPVLYGYQLLPQLVEDAPRQTADQKADGRTYGWANTEGFIDGEELKLRYASDALSDALAQREPARKEALLKVAQQYRELVQNQKTIDQYIQYNRFWQHAIHTDRERFDRMTKVYDLVSRREQLRYAGDGPETDIESIDRILAEALGPPELPAFVEVIRSNEGRQVVLRVPVYTDIDDEGLLQTAERVIESVWTVTDGDTGYSVDVIWRRLNIPDVPRGAHIDIAAHARNFPADGAVLTAGANTTHSYTGRYIALGTGPLPHRVLAHEFGHVLGFRDGYFRGYRDVGDDGFEILELALRFDDIMSAPREGVVHPVHFKMLLEPAPRP